MKIALVYPPTNEENLRGYPLGLGYLCASLKRKHEVKVFNYNGLPFYKSLKNFYSSVRKWQPSVVAISFNSFNRWGAYKIIKKIKKIDKNIKVVLGGVHPSIMFDQLFIYFKKNIDFIIRSEGEESFYELCNLLEDRSDYSRISGLVYRDLERKMKANSVSRIVTDLDSLMMPDYSFAAEGIKRDKLAYLITSRGCPVNCSFCSTSSFWGQKVRMNSPERIAQEVEYVKSLGARKLFFHDDTFNLGIDRTIKIAKILKKLEIEYVVQCRVKPVNEEMIAALIDSGCRHISWGIESLSEKILKTIDKKITPEEIKKAFDICSKFTDKLSTSAYCCVGIPGENDGTIKETIGFMNKNIKSTHGPGASILYILPGTRIYERLVKEGKFNEKVWLKSNSVYYYTQEHNIRTLNKWRKMINRSGIRLEFKGRYFWDNFTEDSKQGSLQKRIKKTSRKLSRFINLMRNRY